MHYMVNKERENKKERKKEGKKRLFMSCLSVKSNCFSLLCNQAACTGSSEIAAYVTGPVLEISDGISLLQNTVRLLFDTYTAKWRDIFAFFSNEKQETSYDTLLHYENLLHYLYFKIMARIFCLFEWVLFLSQKNSFHLEINWVNCKNKDEFSPTHKVRVNSRNSKLRRIQTLYSFYYLKKFKIAVCECNELYENTWKQWFLNS